MRHGYPTPDANPVFQYHGVIIIIIIIIIILIIIIFMVNTTQFLSMEIVEDFFAQLCHPANQLGKAKAGQCKVNAWQYKTVSFSGFKKPLNG